DPNEPEFFQAVQEVLESLVPFLEKNPQYEANSILERITEPERVIFFKVPWEDDKGTIQVNRGFRVQFNGAIGPYKGGLRFHPSVVLGTLKFLGFEQTFKNSLTGLPIGGGKGGSDFDPQGKSDAEVRRFCESFMTELYRHIGGDVDVPAGDIGVGGREIGYLFGQYRRIKATYDNAVLTGKGLNYGGSLIRPEATGYGLVYFVEEMLKETKTSFKGKSVIVSGYGNVAWGVAKKVEELGGKVISISGRDGFIHDPKGVTGEKIEYLLTMRDGKAKLSDYAKKFGVKLEKGKPWGIKADIAVPCAVQNEIGLAEAKVMVKNGIVVVAEGANMPCTPEAVEFFHKNKVGYAPGKAANAGGVATSALEMSQNSMRLFWTAKEVDDKLKGIMQHIYKESKDMSKKYKVTLAEGANIAGFKKVADTMIAQGAY
ncbi:MAG: NADP-specific glutamate dehydrogenase, partial [Fusobacteriaceae bacterium]